MAKPSGTSLSIKKVLQDQSAQTMKRRKDDVSTQTQQQQSMQNAMRFLPILFGVFSWNFPTGLVLYFATSNIFRVGQQAYTLGLDSGGTPSAGTLSTQTSQEPVDPKPISSGPSPNASKKKRNRRRRK